MAVYATRDDLEAALGTDTLRSIADRDGDGSADDDVCDAALLDASGIADSYIEVSYQQPIAVVPTMLKRAVIQIANQLLRVGDFPNDLAKAGYDEAISWLKDVSTGKAILPGQPNVDDGTIDPGDPLIVAGDRVWDRRIATRLF